jgi:crotonobetainyl-CoA:carnitine CoA-transferase CaiB-like acyl-CoA transferase
MDGLAPRMDAVPAIGEHTRAILAELGYSAPEMDAFARSGVI